MQQTNFYRLKGSDFIKNKDKYLNSLYGKILYVLQINNQDNDFITYKRIIKEYLNN